MDFKQTPKFSQKKTNEIFRRETRARMEREGREESEEREGRGGRTKRGREEHLEDRGRLAKRRKEGARGREEEEQEQESKEIEGQDFLGVAEIFAEDMCAKFRREGIPLPLLVAYAKLVKKYLDLSKKIENLEQEEERERMAAEAKKRSREKRARKSKGAEESKILKSSITFTKISQKFMYAIFFPFYFVSCDISNSARKFVSGPKTPKPQALKTFLDFIFRDIFLGDNLFNLRLRFAFSLFNYYLKVNSSIPSSLSSFFLLSFCSSTSFLPLLLLSSSLPSPLLSHLHVEQTENSRGG
jgi:hypothetical protein